MTNSGSPVLDEAVLAATAQVLAEHGWHDFTLERVAEASGISRVTLYRRGITKDVLLDALVVGAAQAWQAAIWPAMTAHGSGADRLQRAMRAACAVVEEHLRLLAGLSTVPDPVFHLGESDRAGRSTRDVYVAPLRRLLQDGQADGSVQRHLDAEETATLLFNVITRTYLHMRAGHGWPPDRAADSLLDLITPGLLTRTADTAPDTAADTEE
ncbi:TetR/AcrR family transcriptional regulator [Streptomyces phaeochromogenes]|uniref:TetR/AcrR family transcriptional regulator n=1 Tax=Streptomyces phaeochromogenes TaxID=1923 RepID=UPI002E2CD31F|nr:TetR/AcrR family transcriptional regulator [Streptomyces phaeochromogenes]